jgi:hypothetical protein
LKRPSLEDVMRRTMLVAAALSLTTLAPAGATSGTDAAQVTDLLARARAALGGEARLASIHSVVLRGSIETGSAQSRSRTYGSFEWTCVLPSSFVRRLDIANVTPGHAVADGGTVRPHRSHEITVLGLDDGRLIYEPDMGPVFDQRVRPATEKIVRATAHDIARLRALAEDEFLRVTLGMFATSFAAAPVTFLRVPVSPSALTVTGSGTGGLLSFDRMTALPVAFRGFSYSDHRVVDGILVPHRISRASGPVVEIWTIDEVRINVPVDPKVFGRQ